MEQADLLAFVVGFHIIDSCSYAGLVELPEEAAGYGAVNTISATTSSHTPAWEPKAGE